MLLIFEEFNKEYFITLVVIYTRKSLLESFHSVLMRVQKILSLHYHYK